MRLTWLRGPRRPANRAGAALLAVVMFGGILTAAAGIGYTAARPLLDNGSAFLPKGHTAASVNSQTGESESEIALQLATGKEQLQTVRLPGGRLAIVNKDTNVVTYLDAATLTPDSDLAPDDRPGPAGKIEVLPTDSDGYLIDKASGTVKMIVAPGTAAPEPMSVDGGIKTAVPSTGSIWIVTAKGDLIEISDGREARRVQLGTPPLGVTVADSHPIAVTTDGTAYVIDGAQPRAVGRLGVSGPSVILGAWRGAGRQILAVDRERHVLAVLDPRTGRAFTVPLKAGDRAELAAPVMLGDFAYVPDHARPGLWKIDLRRGLAAGRPLDVPGQPGVFELQVTSGRVWANSQYDRRALIVDATGHERYADKGAGPELTDTEGQTGPPATTKPTRPRTENPPPVGNPRKDTGKEPQSHDETPQRPATPAKTVTVPAFERGTPYQEACQTITLLGLRCQPLAAGQEEPGLDAGDVLDTRPAAGRQIPEGGRVVVRYLGPLQTPTVVGLTFRDACRRLTAVKLRCAPTVASEAASAPEQLGVVSGQDPAPGTEIGRGDTVTVTYPGTIALPTLTGQLVGEACGRLKDSYGMTCRQVEGDPPPKGGQPAQVYAQDPAAGEIVATGGTVVLRHYRGTSAPGNVVGTAIATACAAIQADGLQCVPVEGNCAGGTGRPVGEVYAQEPPGSTPLSVGSEVKLTHYSEKCTLAHYVEAEVQTACNDIKAKGFDCNAAAALHPTPNVVFAQDPAAGPAQLGTRVTIQYSPWAPVQTGLGAAAYPPNTAIPQGRLLYHYTCGAGGGKCRGLDRNEFFSLLPPGSPTVDADFQGTPHAVLMTCGTAQGQTRMWRTWNKGSPRRYQHVRSETRPALPDGDSEELGCVW
ncbi:PASTA domain-containing protein [Streptosporangium sp. NPDC002524]|uniref:PASTA domain-containing protein n=1 Tax=Streptosporangium sp. NPDC002524 TaxID=3154537 RepID=UPI00331F1822